MPASSSGGGDDPARAQASPAVPDEDLMDHIVALSGGKDSTAMALRLAELEPRDYVYVCTPTGDEPRALFEHLDHMERLLGMSLVRLQDPRGLRGLIRAQRMVPNHRARCWVRAPHAEPAHA